MSIDDFLQKYLGKAYDECDCWDITKLFYKEVLGITFPIETDYGTPGNDDTYRKKVSNIIEIHKCKFKEVEELKVGDVILFNIFGIAAHIGIYIGDNKFIHSIREAGCCVEPLYRWYRKVKGYYRWPN